MTEKLVVAKLGNPMFEEDLVMIKKEVRVDNLRLRQHPLTRCCYLNLGCTGCDSSCSGSSWCTGIQRKHSQHSVDEGIARVAPHATNRCSAGRVWWAGIGCTTNHGVGCSL